jgi:hypothetical protein
VRIALDALISSVLPFVLGSVGVFLPLNRQSETGVCEVGGASGWGPKADVHGVFNSRCPTQARIN